MTAETIVSALSLRRAGVGRWRGACPCCGGASRFQVRDHEGKTLLYCFGGCSQAEIIAELRSRGLWPQAERREFTPAEKREWAERRRAAEELVRWRAWAKRTLIKHRNVAWDLARAGDRWLQSDRGRAADLDAEVTRQMITVATDGRWLGEEIERAVERLAGLGPAEVVRLRSRMGERRAA